MIAVAGDIVEDVVVWGTQHIERGTDTPVRIFRAQGGSAANVAAAVARQGGAARFIGRVGDDAAGTALESVLQGIGIDTRLQRGGRTGTIVILIDETGERSMLPDRAAAAELEPIDPEWLAGAHWLHVPMYGLGTPEQVPVFLELAREAARRGIPVSVDASSLSLLRGLGVERVAELLEAMTPRVVLANAEEAAFLGWDTADARPAPIVVVKRGPDPVTVRTADDTIDLAVPLVPDVVDTTGAGDAFAAGFLMALVDDATPEAAAQAGIASAARVLSTPGSGW